MAELPLDQAIPRFKANEDRVDRFTNGNDTTTWLTADGQEVPSLRKFLKDKDTEINGAGNVILSGAQDAASLATAKAAEALASASAAEDALNEVLEQKNQFDTEVAFEAANIPLLAMYVEVAGYYSAGDGGRHTKMRIAEPSPVEPWHKQSADGAWWQIAKQRLDVRMFGAKVDGDTDDAPAINIGLRLSALYGVELFQPAGTSMQGSTIMLRHGSAWVGFNYLSIVKKLSTFNGAAVQSENYSTLTGTGDAFAASVPERVCVKYITLDGNYQNTARTAYVQANGQGVQIFARKIQLYLRVFNMQGIGVNLECPGGNGPTPLQPGFSREAELVLYTHQTQFEGFVFKGPPDVKLDWILQADAGSRIIADELNGKVSSPTYGAINGGQTFGVVFDGFGAEVGEIHTFGNYGGGGIDWRGGRINADLLMAESCHFGGIRISGNACGMVSKLDVHRTGGFGGDNTADLIYAGTGNNNYGVEIAMCSVYRGSAAHTGARNGIEVTGDFLDIGIAKVDLGSTATAGHGIYVDNDTAQWITINGGEVGRCKGIAPDDLASSAVYRKTAGNGSNVTIKVQVRDCDVAFRSTGTPRVETIDIQFLLNTGQTPFVGDVRINNGQEWNVRGTVNGVWKGSKVRMAVTFNSMLTTVQSVAANHNLIAAPGFGRISTAFVDIGTGINLVDGMPGIKIAAYDETNITVEYKQAVATGTDTVPRVWLDVEI